MEVITIESQAFRELQSKINLIAKFVTAIESKQAELPEDGRVDSYEVCTFLKISDRTLQRLRTAGAISFSRIRGKNFTGSARYSACCKITLFAVAMNIYRT
jgi:hypothetical protein